LGNPGIALRQPERSVEGVPIASALPATLPELAIVSKLNDSNAFADPLLATAAKLVPDDGGKTWEVNWITDQTPVKDEAVKTH
jgi:hypothetical protein